MPKEYIRSNVLDADEKQFRVRVGWNREAGYVQIATVDPDVEAERGGDGYRLGTEIGLFVDLDRTAINDLIRVLRRARDQAYGRDE